MRMALAARAAARAAAGICALLGPCLARRPARARSGRARRTRRRPIRPPKAGDGQVELTWGAVTDATRYVILWDNNPDAATYDNEITDIEGTSYTHDGPRELPQVPLQDRRGDERRARPGKPRRRPRRPGRCRARSNGRP